MLDDLGLGEIVRDMYSHSIFGEFYYRLLNLVLRDKMLLKQVMGFDMILDIGNSGLEKELFLNGVREKESTEILLDYLQEGMNVVDIGANIGYYPILEAREVTDSGKVMAIEPAESTFEKLEKNCRLNGFENINPVNKAVGSEQEEVGIVERSSPNLNRVVNKDSSKACIEQDSLDNLVNFEPDIVRMDVQGYELEILKGMEDVLKSDNLMLFIEVHPSKIGRYYEGDVKEFWNILSDNNFQVKYLIRHPPRPRPSYFFRRSYPPKKVLNPGLSVEKTRKKYSEFFDWESVFRIFLVKNNQ